MAAEYPEISAVSGEAVARAILRGFVQSAAALCVCDDADLIRYANPKFRDAFFPGFDGCPADFMATITATVKAGKGIRLVSTLPDEFASTIRRRRRLLVGSQSFSTDMVNGSWWSVTDTKLSDGWMLIVAQDITALKREEAKLRDAHDIALAEAQTDFLTGVPNRRYGLRRGEALFNAGRAAGTHLSLALLDVDLFKSINDIYGHEAGDRALVHFAAHMAAAIGPEDQFSRLGGDEFLIVRAQSGGLELRCSLADALETLPPLELPGSSDLLRLSISIGVAESRACDTWAGLLHRADMALYDAKIGGRNRITLAA